MATEIRTLYQHLTLPTEDLVKNTGEYLEPKEPWHSYRAWAISPKHVRSIQLANYEKEMRYDPEYPDIAYKARSIKGYPIHPVELVYWETAKYGVQAYGLLDDCSLERVEKSSKIMRQGGLETEKIIGKALVEKVLYKDEYIPVDDWKRLMLENLPVVANPEDPNVTVLPEMIKKYLRETKFYTIIREVPIGERICDLVEASNRIDSAACYKDSNDVLRLAKDGLPVTSVDEVLARQKDDIPVGFRNELAQILNMNQIFPDRNGVINSGLVFSVMMDQVFNWHNETVRRARSLVWEKKEVLRWYMLANRDSADFEHVGKYLIDILPSKMGYFLAKLHALGLHHGFPTEHNWFLIGALGDLDSVGGSPLGDEPTTEKLIVNDLTNTGSSFFKLLDKPNISVKIASEKKRTYQGFIRQTFDTKGAHLYGLSKLASAYIVETARSKNELSTLDRQIENGLVEREFIYEMCPFYKMDEIKATENEGRFEIFTHLLKAFREVEKNGIVESK